MQNIFQPEVKHHWLRRLVPILMMLSGAFLLIDNVFLNATELAKALESTVWIQEWMIGLFLLIMGAAITK
jgi:hypothetical protein